ncbi:AbrB/MazE/SpoVT family DNA-binding domain-containing protein [Roseomonas sp. BN140053]|uniref:AbrB/MazE/SpoVT family DNA-binding domain-containing protein n=1 Tax=Roseomonas sp. BN140053 TaxID=3391898 RepID=UPI0039E9B4BA
MTRRVHAVRMNAQGRMVVPAALRAALGLQGGGQILLFVRDGELRGRNRAESLGQIRAQVAASSPENLGMLDEILAQLAGPPVSARARAAASAGNGGAAPSRPARRAGRG